MANIFEKVLSKVTLEPFPHIVNGLIEESIYADIDEFPSGLSITRQNAMKIFAKEYQQDVPLKIL